MKRSAVPIVIAVLGAALVGLLVYGVVARQDDSSLDAAVSQGKLPAAPGASIGLPVLGGSGSRTLADYRGHVAVVNFWASWCPPCKAESATLVRAQGKLAKSGGTIVGVTYKDDPAASRKFVRENKLNYPSITDGRLDLAPKFGTTKLPETFVLDRRGRVVAMSRGQVDDAFLTRAIAAAQQIQ